VGERVDAIDRSACGSERVIAGVAESLVQEQLVPDDGKAMRSCSSRRVVRSVDITIDHVAGARRFRHTGGARSRVGAWSQSDEVGVVARDAERYRPQFVDESQTNRLTCRRDELRVVVPNAGLEAKKCHLVPGNEPWGSSRKDVKR